MYILHHKTNVHAHHDHHPPKNEDEKMDDVKAAAFRAGTGFYSCEQVARILGVTYQTLANWRSKGMGPRYVKIGGQVRYRPFAIEEYQKYGEPNGLKPSKVPELRDEVVADEVVADESDSSETPIPDVQEEDYLVAPIEGKQPTQSIFQEDAQPAGDQVKPDSVDGEHPEPKSVDCRLG